MRVRVLVVLCLSWLMGAPLTAQQGGPDQAAVAATANAFHAGLKSGDTAAVMQLIADDALMFEAGGSETRAEYQKNHLPADIEFEKAVKTTRGPVRVVVNGTSAWASSTSEFVGSFQGRPVDSIGVELMVLTKESTGWRIRAISWSGRSRLKPAP